MMKKIIIILASAAALLLAGCTKERSADMEGNCVKAVYTVCTQNTSTRATVDEDGAAAGVSRFVMEVYRNHDGLSELFYRKVNTVTKGVKETSFDVTFLKDQQYDILFWADCGEGEADKYYVTTDGLKSVSFKGTYIGNDDDRDAFSNAVSVSVGSSSLPEQTIYLYRPFAQLNIITTDIDNLALATATSGNVVCPDTVVVSYTAPAAFNVLTKLASGSASYSYEALPYYQTTGKDSNSIAQDKYTLSMDYILASADEQDIHSITMTAKAKSYVLNTNVFDNIPLQRNWRTNIVGALLTVSGKFEVIVEPAWTDETDITL